MRQSSSLRGPRSTCEGSDVLLSLLFLHRVSIFVQCYCQTFCGTFHRWVSPCCDDFTQFSDRRAHFPHQLVLFTMRRWWQRERSQEEKHVSTELIKVPLAKSTENKTQGQIL